MTDSHPLRRPVAVAVLVRPRVLLFGAVLALTCAPEALAADVEAGGASGTPAVRPESQVSTPETGESQQANQPVIEQEHPVLTGEYQGVSNPANDYVPTGLGTNRPLGFTGRFAPISCHSNLASGTTADRSINLSVSGSETFSDNINQDSDEKTDFVTAVSPRLDLCSSTGRIRGQLSYQATGVVYANNSTYNDVYNDVWGSTNINVFDNHLFLDANTRYGDEVIDPAAGYTHSHIIRPKDNKTTSWRVNVSPYWVQPLGWLGQGVLRYRYGYQTHDKSEIADTTVNGASASVTSPASAGPLTWNAQAVTQRVKRSGGREQLYLEPEGAIQTNEGPIFVSSRHRRQPPDRTQYFDSATLQLGYRLSRTLTLTGLGGVEDQYHSNGENDRWSAPRWQVGLRWQNGANSLEVDYGHRFYGASYGLTAAHHGRNLDLSLSYDEDPSSPGLDSLNSLGSGGFTFPGLGNYYEGYDEGYADDSLRSRGVYVRKRWRARAVYHTALTTIGITGFLRHHDYEEAGAGEHNRRSHGIYLDVHYELGPRTHLVPTAEWRHYNNGYANRSSSDTYDAGIALVRELTPSIRAAAGYTRSWRDSADGGYTENRATVQLRKTFF